MFSVMEIHELYVNRRKIHAQLSTVHTTEGAAYLGMYVHMNSKSCYDTSQMNCHISAEEHSYSLR